MERWGGGAILGIKGIRGKRLGSSGYRDTIQCFDIIYIVWENIYTSVRIQVYYIIMMFAACLPLYLCFGRVMHFLNGQLVGSGDKNSSRPLVITREI